LYFYSHWSFWQDYSLVSNSILWLYTYNWRSSNTNPTKNRGWTGRVSNSCSTRSIRRVNLVTNPVISQQRGKDHLQNSNSKIIEKHLTRWQPYFSFGHCVVCSSSIYRFWLPPFGIFNLVWVITSNYNSNLDSSLRNCTPQLI
jgi:hypothetical protein